MHPYRAHELRRPTLELRSKRAFVSKLAGGVTALAAAVALVVYFMLAGGGTVVLPFGPFALGIVLLAQARFGAIELRPEERAGEVVLRGPLRATRTTFSYRDVVGSAVTRVTLNGRPTGWELQLALTKKRTIPLVQGGDAEIDAALERLDAFLADHGLTR